MCVLFTRAAPYDFTPERILVCCLQQGRFRRSRVPAAVPPRTLSSSSNPLLRPWQKPSPGQRLLVRQTEGTTTMRAPWPPVMWRLLPVHRCPTPAVLSLCHIDTVKQNVPHRLQLVLIRTPQQPARCVLASIHSSHWVCVDLTPHSALFAVVVWFCAHVASAEGIGGSLVALVAYARP